MLIDYHVHTARTIDAKSHVDEYCKQAIKIGVTEICFTNHQEMTSVDDGSYDYALTEKEWEEVMEEIEKARKKYPSLTLKFGTEVGYYPKKHKEIRAFIKRYPFDFVMGSIHNLDGEVVSDTPKEEDWKKSEDEIIEKHKHYFAALKKAIGFSYCDCLGHIDIRRRNLPHVDFSCYKEAAKKCISAMKENNIGFEINTGGWRYIHKEQHPSEELLELLRKANLKKVAIGSDAHEAKHLGYKIKEGLSLLKKHGFENVCTFEKRKAKYDQIPDIL